MAPVEVTKNYYAILEVEQSAKLELITQSYKRLALKLHPDHNKNANATAAFQRLVEAYTILKDKSTRSKYDLVYPIIRNSQRSNPYNASCPPSREPDESSQIANIQKTKQERSSRWWIKKQACDSTIFELQRTIRQLEQKIKELDSVAAAEAAEEAQKSSWSTWLLSTMYTKVDESEEVKSRKDRAQQERRIERDMKERLLKTKTQRMKEEQDLLALTKQKLDAADRVDDEKIQALRHTIWARQAKGREECSRVERERAARLRKTKEEQQRRRDQEAAEALWRRQAEERQRQQDQTPERQGQFNRQSQTWQAQSTQRNGLNGSTRGENPVSTCQHNRWWTKVQGRERCPECSDLWLYLLQCPSCQKKACPKCRGAKRLRRTEKRPGTS